MAENTYAAIDNDKQLAAGPGVDGLHPSVEPRSDAPAPPEPFRFTVDDACAMGETDIFRDTRVELIGGQFLVKEPGAPSHAGKVDRLSHLLHTMVGETHIVRVQSCLRISDIDLPEPDLSVLQRREDFYENGHPEPKDVLFMIEVANTSLQYDQSTKASLYAAAGIETYWIVDVHAETVFVHTDPSEDTYGHVQRCARGDTLTLPVPAAPELPVNDLFPDPAPSHDDS